MRSILSISIALIALAALTGCGHDAVSTATTSNPDVPVQLLFEHDGVKVYRFEDFGNHVYYTVPSHPISYHTGGKSDHLVQTGG